jgi:hypothetical protein
MYRHYKKSYVPYIFLFLVSALFFACIGCDSLLPTDFKAKNFTPSDIDARAGHLLTSDTLNDPQGFTVSYQYVAVDSFGAAIGLNTPKSTVGYRSLPVTWSIVLLDTNIINNTIIHSSFDSLTTVYPTLHEDSLIVVTYPKNMSVCYAVLKSDQAKDMYLYTSLLYYYYNRDGSSNFSDYVTVELVKRDTTVISPSPMISVESEYGMTEKIQTQTNIQAVPVINACYPIHLDQGSVYLVRFTLSNPKEISNPMRKPASVFGSYPSIANQFKVVILSY